MSINGIKACVFDAYGTMFDVHSPVSKLAENLGDKAQPVSIMWRDKQLQYTWLRSLMRDFAPFSEVTSDALTYALEANGVEDPELHKKLMDAYYTLDAYDDVAPCLDALRLKGLKTAILSNGSPDMLSAAVKSAGLKGKLDAVLSVDRVGVNKPDPRVYQMTLDHFGIKADEVCFISNNAWDSHGGAHFGYQVARLNRYGAPAEKLSGAPRIIMTGLDELAGALSE
ncbi:MAG: haloacid dehalogenase type II [Hyphomicrobiales bacterium]